MHYPLGIVQSVQVCRHIYSPKYAFAHSYMVTAFIDPWTLRTYGVLGEGSPIGPS